ncbi:hypothetical protein GQ43DRAFT_446049 [Delitschia confertaspora ATCC 74209]|uniref:Histone-lysine N-methyltransferase, H3 lysine-36 specific n=1 Tax=Delitschia confertaspora ATCC 74209 TaxID=1513339 RepID=A0A9P4JTR8_9PLEO|nr:hypothetical protein GQ43DRAFT_446049 [Delitschia confertaspora ATCC 74209]
MKIEEGGVEAEGANGAVQVKVEDQQELAPTTSALNDAALPPPQSASRSTTQSPSKQQSPNESPSEKGEQEEVVGGDITLKMEPGKAPKLSRTASQKVAARPPPLFLDLPDATAEASRTFQVLPECSYGAKHMGTTEHALECDCAEEWDVATKTNLACGEDSDCINRATKMECAADCGCGAACQNQRFLHKQWANVAVIKTEKKGYGLRANTDLKAHDFIFEYIGEVINEAHFRRRMIQYDQEGIKHFYFMSLSKGEFVDATKKGNLGRFCNHSCNPNCYVDKWVVGDKLRMGIFAERNIKAGEELVFNYNVDRYGADPQPCYCGEPNCTGFIGGKTQTERATKLSNATIEALGIDDGDGWDTAVAKKPRKKKVSEEDEEYINDIQPKSLEESGVTKVMAALMQCKEKWIAVKLLGRLQQSDDEKVGHRVIRMHGYTILKTTLNTWIDDFNIVLQVLDILDRLPRITRNKIQDSKIEETVEKLTTCDDEGVQSKATQLLEAWRKLKVGYRIPRMKRDPNAGTPVRTENHFDRREKARERSKSPSPPKEPPRGPAVPSGPRNSMPQRNAAFFNGPRPPFRPRPPPFETLPPGWFKTTLDNGSTYYYNTSGVTQWQKPTTAAPQPPPPPPKEKTHQQKLQDIITSITQSHTPKNDVSASATPQPASGESNSEKKSGSEKWRKLPEEKRMRIYENTLYPHVKSVTDHYRKKLEKEDLKRLAKEVGKKLVRGDFKTGRVQDPTAKLSSKHERNVKKFVKEFFDKAVAKKAIKDKERAARAAQKAKEQAVAGKSAVKSDSPETPIPTAKEDKEDSDDEMIPFSDNEDDPSPASPSDLKRKRGADDDHSLPKRTRTDTPPPPPPPPPAEDMPADMADLAYTSMEQTGNLNGELDHGKPSKPSELLTGIVSENRESLKANNHPSPMQLATPPTTTNGSCEHDTEEKDGSQKFAGLGSGRRREVSVSGGS